MDLQQLTHRNLRVTTLVALVLSGLIVAVTALLARGVIHLQTSLFEGTEPRDIAVILAFEREHPTLTVTNVEKIERHEDETVFRYLVTAKEPDGTSESYFTTISGTAPWTELSAEKMH